MRSFLAGAVSAMLVRWALDRRGDPLPISRPLPPGVRRMGQTGVTTHGDRRCSLCGLTHEAGSGCWRNGTAARWAEVPDLDVALDVARTLDDLEARGALIRDAERARARLDARDLAADARRMRPPVTARHAPGACSLCDTIRDTMGDTTRFDTQGSDTP